jgi:hypothetical protein
MTNNNGNFSFTNVPFGNYSLWVEYPGRSMTALPVSLSSTSPSVTGLNFTVNLTNVTTSVQEPSAIEVSSLYPNPVSSELNLRMNVKERATYIFRMLDVSGRVISERINEMTTGEQSLRMETEDLTKGLYLLQIIGEGKTVGTYRFVK